MNIEEIVEQIKSAPVFQVPNETAEEVVEKLFQAARACRLQRSYSSALEACRATRTAATMIVNTVSFDPVAVPVRLVRRAERGIRTCVHSVQSVYALLNSQTTEQDGQKVARLVKALSSMGDRLKTMKLLSGSGVSAVHSRFRKLSRGA